MRDGEYDFGCKVVRRKTGAVWCEEHLFDMDALERRVEKDKAEQGVVYDEGFARQVVESLWPSGRPVDPGQTSLPGV